MHTNKGQKLAIAGTATLLAEPALALAHTGGLGVIVGLAVGAVTYWLVDELDQTDGEDLSPSTETVEVPTKQTDDPGQPSLLYRMFNGKSIRGDRHGDATSDQNTESP